MSFRQLLSTPSAFRTIQPIGPLAFEGIDLKFNSFYFNSTEILFVNHANNADVPVLALCSDQGEIFHVVLVQTHPLHYLVLLSFFSSTHNQQAMIADRERPEHLRADGRRFVPSGGLAAPQSECVALQR